MKIEIISAKVHESWRHKKTKQGFHAPVLCESPQAVAVWESATSFPKFFKFCSLCHPDMYTYDVLPEEVKERIMLRVKSVVTAIEECSV